jgi:hypothetical protein
MFIRRLKDPSELRRGEGLVSYLKLSGMSVHQSSVCVCVLVEERFDAFPVKARGLGFLQILKRPGNRDHGQITSS